MSTAALLVADLVDPGTSTTHARRNAFVEYGNGITFAELHDGARRWGALLRDNGFVPGDRVALLAENGSAYLQVLCAASLLGAAVVLLNRRLTARDLHFQLVDSGARFAIIGRAFVDLATAAGAYDLTAFTVDDDLARRLQRVHPMARTTPRPDAGAPFIVLYTSGTTGVPKGCVLSQQAWLAGATNITHGLDLRASDVWVGAGPFFHVAALGMATSILAVGGTVVIDSAHSPEEMWEVVRERGVTIGGFPAGLLAALRHPLCDTNAKSLRIVIKAAGAFSPRQLADVAERVPHARLCGVYGSTEAGNYVTIASTEEELSRPATIGRPLLGFRAAILGDDDHVLPAGEVGELGLRGSSVMSGYWGLPDATEDTLRGGWLHTGDAMRADEDGYLYFLDRVKDMIKPGGENVYGIEVEQALLAHPDVDECAVIGVPDDRWGEAVKAVVVVKGDVDATALDAWCLETIASYKRPRWYEFVSVLPRGNAAKVDKRLLRAEHDPVRCVRLRERDR
jgi:acyl-CoA synthetase (AMP-forming)/AMP-acid ligase II